MGNTIGGGAPASPSDLPVPVQTIPENISAPSLDDVAKGLSSGAGESSQGQTGALNASVLERIAAAAGTLKDNQYANDLIKLMHEQETSWQEKFKSETAENQVRSEQEKQNFIRVQEEERRRTLEYQQQQHQEKAQYDDQMARKRYDDQLRQQHEASERERQLNMQSTREQENEKRRSMEYQSQLDRETEKIKAAAEGTARAQAERENRDIRDEQLLLRAEQDRITALESVREAGKVIGEGVTSYLSDKEKIATTIGLISAVAVGVYGARTGTTVLGKYIQDKVMKPPLVRDTSRTSIWTSPLKTLRRLFSSSKGDTLDGIVLKPVLERRMRDFTIATAHTRRHGANFRNLMLYGPPGTGKTLFATRLAKQSGLEYAVLAGGDVAPLGKDAITELHKVFDWSENSRKGTLLFIDEADAFLRKRGTGGDGMMSEEQRNALSTFLYRTGTPSNKTMIVIATNEPTTVDSAILDRMDEAVEFGLPEATERERLFEQYFDELIVNPKNGAQKIRLADDIQDVSFSQYAEETKGFSGRQIMKLVTAWQASSYATVDNTLTKDIMQEILTEHRAQSAKKQEWDRVSATSARKH